ncbi:MAG: HAD family hydrolase [Parcubacteria group bacterium]|nr:MAG: HAD family hydrolase [Parcubacteria group bacterium]
MIRNIIFDWSGVIVDDLVAVHKTTMLLFKEMGVKEISLAEFKKEWEQPYMLFYNKYNIQIRREEEQAMFRSLYKSVSSECPSKPYSSVKDTLERFKKSGVNMIVVSSSLVENIEEEIERFGLQGLFNEINGDIHDKAEIIHETIERNNFNPEETIFIGDTTHEVEAGRKANALTATVTWGYQGEDKLKSSNPDFIIHDLKELESVVLN